MFVEPDVLHIVGYFIHPRVTLLIPLDHAHFFRFEVIEQRRIMRRQTKLARVIGVLCVVAQLLDEVPQQPGIERRVRFFDDDQTRHLNLSEAHI